MSTLRLDGCPTPRRFIRDKDPGMVNSAGSSSAGRAILYARVSTRSQASDGYSLAQQLEALRQYAASMGYKIVEEVMDSGQSATSLRRPGLDSFRLRVSGRVWSSSEEPRTPHPLL
jgi:predicted site-specific integrase-resolvase